ncbi:MAG: DUF302 domain-containing protein [Thermodesulfobacteriota bacterium]
MSELIKIETDQSVAQVIEKIQNRASDFDFIIRNIFNMADEFKNHGVEVQNDFEYYSIMLCNPQKAYESITKKPLRGAALLPPKQVVVFKENEKTVISYVAVEENDIKAIMPEDEMFQKGLANSCSKIKELIQLAGRVEVNAPVFETEESLEYA